MLLGHVMGLRLMASSGDELDSYEQSPRALASSTSNADARPVAGPSKPSSQRIKDITPDTVEVAKPTASIMDTIAISSDEEDVQTTRRGRSASGIATQPTSNGRANSARGKRTTTVTAKRKKVADAGEVELLEHTAPETDAEVPASRRDKVRLAAGTSTGKTHELLRKQIERLQKQVEEVSNQRDDMSSQLEKLFQLRHTGPETRMAEQKAQYEAIMKVKEDTIHELQTALSQADKLSRPGATTTLHFLTRETADEEKQDIQREVAKLKDSLKKKDEIIRAKDVGFAELNETIKVLNADLKTEIENAKALSSRNPPSSAVKHASKWSDPKTALAIRLYEELTNLLVTNVRHEPGKYREDDAIYTCVQTTTSGKCLNFSLRFCKELEDGETPSSANRNGRTVDKVIYTPLLLEKETQEFVRQLDFLAQPFTFQKEQMSVFTKTLLTYLEGEAEDSQSSADQMEVEGY